MRERIEHIDGGVAHCFIADNGDRVLVIARDEMIGVLLMSGAEAERLRPRRGRPRRATTEVKDAP